MIIHSDLIIDKTYEFESANFVKLAEIYPWRSFMSKKLPYLELPRFERSAPPV